MATDHSLTTDPDILTMTRDLGAMRLTEGEEDLREEASEADELDVQDDNLEDESDDELLEWDDFNKNVPSLTAPKCGGLFLSEDKKVIAFVGTDPDAKVNVWTYDPEKDKYVINKKTVIKHFTHQKGPVWNGQFRPSSLKDIKKVEETCKEFKGTKFDGLTSKDGGAPPLGLITYKEIIRRHLIKNGMWNVFQYAHPKSKKNLCLIQHLGKFQLSEIKLHIQKFRETADKFAIQNLDWSGTYLLNSISNSLYKDVLQKVPITASGPEVLMAIVSSFGTYTYDSMEKVKNQFKKVHLSSFPGENVVSMNVKLKGLLDQLHSAGYFEKELLNHLAKKYKTSSCEEFRLWSMSNIDDKTKSYLRLTALQEDKDIAEEDKVSYGDILDLTSKKYEEMYGAEDWTPRVPTKKNSDEPDLPKATIAAIDKAVSASVNKFSSNGHGKGGTNNPHKSGNKSPRTPIPSVDGRCIHCDEKGHEKENCPHKTIPWYKVPPKDKQLSRHHITREGKKPVLYCTQCSSWRYTHMGGHLAKDHDDFLKGPFAPNKKKGKKKVRFTPTATPAMAEEDIPEIPEDEVHEHKESEEEDNDASAFSAIWTQAYWI